MLRPFYRGWSFFYVIEVSNGIAYYSLSSAHLADHKNKGEMNHGYERKTSGTG